MKSWRKRDNMIVQICVGSSCHLKGSYEIVELMKNAVQNSGFSDDVTLAGSFCAGKCEQIGVTVRVDDEDMVKVTKESFNDFWNEHIVKKIEKERRG